MQRSAGNPRKCRSRRVGHAAAPLEIDERYRYSQSSLIILLLLFLTQILRIISPMTITHSTSTYISIVQADDEICADHQVLNDHHSRVYIHKLTRISSSVYLFSTCTSVRFRGGIRGGWSLGVVVILLFVTRRGVSV